MSDEDDNDDDDGVSGQAGKGRAGLARAGFVPPTNVGIEGVSVKAEAGELKVISSSYGIPSEIRAPDWTQIRTGLQDLTNSIRGVAPSLRVLAEQSLGGNSSTYASPLSVDDLRILDLSADILQEESVSESPRCNVITQCLLSAKTIILRAVSLVQVGLVVWHDLSDLQGIAHEIGQFLVQWFTSG